MSKIEQKKGVSYVLVIDKDRDYILNVLMNAVLTDDKLSTRFAITLKNRDLVEVYDKLLDEMIDKSHPLGFCEDESCTWEPKKNKDE